MSQAALAPARRSLIEGVFYTVKDLAVLTGLSERTIWRLSDEGVIPGKVQIGKSVRWSRRIVDGWISKGCPRPKGR